MPIIRLNSRISKYSFDQDIQLRHINCVRFSFTECGRNGSVPGRVATHLIRKWNLY